MLDMTCGTAATILRPPGAPSANSGLPRRKPSTGTMFTSGRLPGATEFRRPGSGSNQIMPFWRRMPVPGTTMREPNSETAVLVNETMLRWRSIAQTWVVQSAVARAAATPRRPPTAGAPPSHCHGSGAGVSLRGPAARIVRASAAAYSGEASPDHGAVTRRASPR